MQCFTNCDDTVISRPIQNILKATFLGCPENIFRCLWSAFKKKQQRKQLGTNILLEGMTRLQIYHGRVGFFQRVLESKSTHRRFNEWKHCCGRLYQCYDVKPNSLIVLWNCLFNVLSTGLCLEAVTWRVVSSSGKSGGPALCAVCCVLPRSCVQPAIGPTHVAELASWKWPSFQKEVMRVNCSGENNITDGVISTLEGFFVFFCFLCENLSMILITEKMIKLFYVPYNFSFH